MIGLFLWSILSINLDLLIMHRSHSLINFMTNTSILKQAKKDKKRKLTPHFVMSPLCSVARLHNLKNLIVRTASRIASTDQEKTI